MKTTLLFPAGLACILLATQALAATDVSTDWYAELNAVQRDSNQTTGGRIRANAVLSAVLLATKDGLGDRGPSHPAEPPPVGANLLAAAAHAAHAVMTVLYPQSQPALDAKLAQSLADIADNDPAIAAGRKWGTHVADVVLAEQSDTVFLNTRTFAATAAPTETSARPDAQAEQQPIGPGRYRFSIRAGTPGTNGYVDAVGAAARFDYLGGIAADAAGNIFVSEQHMSTIRKVAPDGTVTTFAGAAGQSGSRDGMGSAARFNGPSSLAMDASGNIYVADTGNQLVRKIDPLGNVTTLAGQAGMLGSGDGAKSVARLFSPTHVTVDAAGNVYVTERKPYAPIADNPIRKITPDGTVSSLAVEGLDRNYFNPGQILADPAGNLYTLYFHSGPMQDLADLHVVTPTAARGIYTTSLLAATGNEFGEIFSMAMDDAGGLFVYSGWTDFHIHAFTPGSGWQDRYPVANSDSYWMSQIAAGKDDELYFFSDYDQVGAVGVAIFDPLAEGPVITEQPWLNYTPDRAGYPVPGNAVTFRMTAVGGPGLTCQWYFNSSPINGATSISWVLGNVQKNDEGLYYAVVTDGSGSVTSRTVKLTMPEPPPPAPATPPPAPTLPPAAASGSATSGGGGFDGSVALVVVMLLTAAANRRAPAISGVAARFQHCGSRDSRHKDIHE